MKTKATTIAALAIGLIVDIACTSIGNNENK